MVEKEISEGLSDACSVLWVVSRLGCMAKILGARSTGEGRNGRRGRRRGRITKALMKSQPGLESL